MSILIYGATGYTGKLIARMARQLGMSVTLGGRNERKLRALVAETGFEHIAVDLGDPLKLLEIVSKYSVVLHIAGPFSKTAKPMVEACLAGRTHYLDITGEIAVFESHRILDRVARETGIMIMSGVGFDVVPSDCLSLYMKERMPEAIKLTLAMEGLGGMSHGTAKTAIQAINMGTATRRNGTFEFLKKPPRRPMRFGNREVDCVGISWGDVATAYYTTGIPNITVMFELTKDLERFIGLPGLMKWVFSTSPGQAFLRRIIAKLPEGPDPKKQQAQVTQILAIVEDSDGRELRSVLKTPGAYHLTSLTALRIAREVDDGRVEPGSHNPAQVFGSNFIATFDDCTITDIS